MNYHGTYMRLGLPTSATEREVMRAGLLKIKRSARFSYAHRDARKRFIGQLLANHQQAQQLVREWRL